MDPYKRAARIAARQHALITLDQALEAGITPAQVKWLAQNGRWQRIRRGVFLVAGAAATRQQAVMAACLAGGAPASYLTAGRLWPLRTPDPDRIDLLTLADRRIQLRGVRHHRTNVLPPADLARTDGVPVTSVARTLCDVSGNLSVRSLSLAVNDALRKKILRLEQLRATHERLAGGRGRRAHRTMAEVLAQRQAGFDPGDSEWEVWLVETLLAAGLPRPVQQLRVTVPGGTFYLDAAYPPPAKIDLEFDGYDAHGHFEAFHSDRRRTRLLVADGWRVVPVTSRTTEAELVDSVAALLEERPAEPAA